MSLKLQALVANYEAEILSAKAELEVFFNASVGVGEHSCILKEMDKLVDKIATAQGKLDALTTLVEVEVEEESS